MPIHSVEKDGSVSSWHCDQRHDHEGAVMQREHHHGWQPRKVHYSTCLKYVVFQDTYIFLLRYVRTTRKVSYMLYKVHWWESCTVTTTFKKVLYVRMYVRVSCSPPKTFYSKILIYSCSDMSGLLEKYHICDISSTCERVVM